MKKILMVEDDVILAKMVIRKLADTGDFNVIHVTSAAEAAAVLEAGADEYFLGLLDLALPDAPFGEIVDLVAPKLPVAVFSAEMDDVVRETILSKPVLDYVIKQGERSIKLILDLVKRLSKNSEIHALVADDSPTSRTILANILSSHLFQVTTAADGREALEALKKNDRIKLVITDYIMPEMDGLQLLHAIRDDLDRDRTDLAVIGISGKVGDTFSAKFLKYGGNDFLVKPFLQEELICRINQNVEFLEHIEAITRLARHDHLTGLYNRRYFFEVGERYFANAKRENLTLTLVMIDIDHFKKVNDVHGHYAGDQVLKAVAGKLDESFRASDLVARIGGEEFCALASNMAPGNIGAAMERVRKGVEDLVVWMGDTPIKVTISLGVTIILGDSLEEMLNRADTMLYRAKTNGRNRIELDLANDPSPGNPEMETRP